MHVIHFCCMSSKNGTRLDSMKEESCKHKEIKSQISPRGGAEIIACDSACACANNARNGNFIMASERSNPLYGATFKTRPRLRESPVQTPKSHFSLLRTTPELQ